MIESLRVVPGSQPGIAARDTRDDLGLGTKGGREAGGSTISASGSPTLAGPALRREHPGRARSSCRASTRRGKDGVIRSVFSGANPLGIRTASFGVPTETELAHDYLWRIHAALPSARHDRRLQPLALRGRRRGADARAGARGRLATSARAHPRVGADARRRGHDDRQGVPQRRRRRSSGNASRNASTIRASAGSSAWAISRYGERFDEFVVCLGGGHRRDVDGAGRRGTSSRPTANWVKSTAVATLVVDVLERLDPRMPVAEPGIEGLVIA